MSPPEPSTMGLFCFDETAFEEVLCAFDEEDDSSPSSQLSGMTPDCSFLLELEFVVVFFLLELEPLSSLLLALFDELEEFCEVPSGTE